MDLFCRHHQKNLSTIGFLPTRLTYKRELEVEHPEKAPADISTAPRDQAAEAKQLAELKALIETAKTNPEKIKEAIAAQQQIIAEAGRELFGVFEEYNKEVLTYGLNASNRKALLLPDFRIGPMARVGASVKSGLGGGEPFDSIKPAKQSIEQAGKNIDDRSYYIPAWLAPKLKMALMKAKKAFQKYEAIVLEARKKIEYFSDPEKAYWELARKHGEWLDKRDEDIREQTEAHAGAKKGPFFGKMEMAYDGVLLTEVSLPAHSRMKEFDEILGEGVSAERKKEMRELFFSILAENTDQFRERFFLGPDFQDDAAANRENFPFIYHEWMKDRTGDENFRKEADSAFDVLEEAKGRVEDSNDPYSAVKAMITPEETFSDHFTKDPLPPKQNEVPAETLTSAMAARMETYHNNVGSVFQRYVSGYAEITGIESDKLAEEQKKRPVDAAKVAQYEQNIATYRQKQEKLEKYIALEDKYARWYEAEGKVVKYSEKFTRKDLTKDWLENKNEQKLMRMAMMQFQRAVQIVDQSIKEMGTLQSQLHPQVRRMLIALVYRQGVAGYRYENGKTVYKDDLSAEYRPLIAYLAKSPHFNNNLKGKFHLQDNTRAYLFLADHAGWLENNLPGQEEKVKDKGEALKKVADTGTILAENDRTFEAGYDTRLKNLEIGLENTAMLEANSQTLEENLVMIFGADARLKTKLGLDPAATRSLSGVIAGWQVNDVITKAKTLWIAAADREHLVDAGAPDPEKKEAGRKWAIKNPESDAGFALDVYGYIIKYGLEKAQGSADSAQRVQAAWYEYLTERMRLIAWKGDKEKIQKYLQDPESEEAAAFLATLRDEQTVEGKSNAATLNANITYAEHVETGYNMFEMDEKSNMTYLEHLGLNMEGIYLAYLEYIKDHPEMTADRWSDYFGNNDPAEFGKLQAILEAILPENNANGKRDFLVIFESLQTDPTHKHIDGATQGLAMSVYSQIREGLMHRAEIHAAEDQQKEELAAQLNGMNIGDRAEKYIRGVLDMVIGPGQSMANRAAGIVIIMAAWKMIHAAWKDTGTKGKAARLFLMAGAVELAMKQMTGRGLIDRSRMLDHITDTVGGTYKGVLVDKNHDFMANAKLEGHDQGITDEEHVGALSELDTVPFHTVMKWYESTRLDGAAMEGTEADQLWKSMNISADKVRANRKLGWDAQNAQKRAKFILKKTVEGFFLYVAAKDRHSDAYHGKEAVKERWVTAVENPNFSLDEAKASEMMLPPEILAKFRENPDGLTWQMVMSAEIDPSDVKETAGKTALNQTVDFIRDAAGGLARWTRETIWGVALPAVEEFAHQFKDKGEKLLELIGELGSDGAEQLRAGRDWVSLKWRTHHITIKRAWDDTMEFLINGVKVPAGILWKAHREIIPTINKYVRQAEEIVAETHEKHITHELAGADIMTDARFNAPFNGIMEWDKSKNPGYEYFGVYQRSFRSAFEQQFTNGTDEPYRTDAAYEGVLTSPNIGFYISSVRADEVPNHDVMSREQLADEMTILSWERAKERFLGADPNLRPEDIDKYMSFIHRNVKDTDPKTYYTFWRMPLSNSEEYDLKVRGKWLDYWEGNDHKFRLPYTYDTTASMTENIKRALGLYSPGLREASVFMAKYLVQVIRMLRGIQETGGVITGEILAHLPGVDPATAKWFELLAKPDEKSDQLLDEISGSAGNSSLALSNFYKNSNNSAIYEASRNHAIILRKAMNLARPTMPATVPGATAITGWKKVKGFHDDKYYIESATPNELTELEKKYGAGKVIVGPATLLERLNPDIYDGH